VATVIRRAALLHLSAGSPLLVSCAGQTPVDAAADASAESEPPAATGSREAGAVRDGGVDDASVGVESGDSQRGSEEAGAPADAASCQPILPLTVVFGGCEASACCASTGLVFSGSATECGADNLTGLLPASSCPALCPPSVGPPDAGVIRCSVGDCSNCSVKPSTGWVLFCSWDVGCGSGRRPAGLRPCQPRRALSAVAGTLARMANLEAASVEAFGRLARELEAHGAPAAVVVRARRAQRDEVAHARVMTALAERAGSSVPPARARARRERTLEAIAIENAVEGCVRETYGAAVAVVQAMTAGDPSVRRAMETIAHDELRHADLSWTVAEWLAGKLDERARACVRRARDAAARELLESASREPPRDVAEALGLPAAHHARAIARELRAALWT
jgi:hypothetical protein